MQINSFLIKIFVVASFIALLAFSGFLENDAPQPTVSAQDLGYGNPVCDRIIPIGNVIDELLWIVDAAFSVYQGEDLATALDTVTGLVTALGSRDGGDVCDFSVACKPEIADTGGKATFELDAFFASYSISMDPVPPGWCNVSECTGAPCPDVTPYVDGDPAKTGIMGLEKLQKSFEGSAAIINELFTKKTKELSIELVKEAEPGETQERAGDKLTKAAYLDRLIEYVEYWLTPGHTNSCVPSPLEKQLIESRRMGDKYVMKCAEAREQGLYWPKTSSIECEKECLEPYSNKCLNCLKINPGEKGSFLAKINYRIHNKCESECRSKDSDGNFINEWDLNIECEGCLCTKEVKVTGGYSVGVDIDQEECLAWLCGGSTINWVCCHEAPLGGVERPELKGR